LKFVELNQNNKGTFLNFIFLIILIKAPKYIQKGILYEGWNFNSGNYLFTTDTKYV